MRKIGSIGLALLFTAVFIFTGCKNNKIPDVSNIDVKVNFYAYDDELYAIDTTKFFEGYAALHQKYPQFTDFFLDTLLRASDFRGEILLYHPELKAVKDTLVRDSLSKIYLLSDFVKGTKMLYDTCKFEQKDWAAARKDIERGYKFLKYYYPEIKIPDFYETITGFAVAIAPTERFTTVSREAFLGPKYSYWYPRGSEMSAQYMQRTLNPKHLAAWVFKLTTSEYVAHPKGRAMIDEMIYEGKKLALLDAVIPEMHDTIVLGWSKGQYDYVRTSEGSLYKMLVDNNLLLSKDFDDYKKFVTPGPFNPEMASDMPGNSGSWLGWQMVKQYMEKNPGMKLQQLMKETDSQKILKSYKPER